MVTEWALRLAATTLREQAGKGVHSSALTADELADDLVSVTVSALPAKPADWFPFCVLDLGGGVSRIVRAVDTDEKRLTWQRPLLPSEEAAVDLDVLSISSSPLAQAVVYVGGGANRPVTVTLWVNQTVYRAVASEHGYGSGAQAPQIMAGVRWSFKPTVDQDFETYGYLHLQLCGQVADALEYGLPDDCAVIVPTDIDQDWWHEPESGVYVYGADIRAEIEVLA